MKSIEKLIKMSTLSVVEKKNLNNFLKGLTPNRVHLIETIGNLLADFQQAEFVSNMEASIDRSMMASLVLNLDIPYSDLVNSLADGYELIKEDTEKIKKIKSECGGSLEMTVKKLGKFEAPVRERCLELLRQEVKDVSKALVILQSDFPTLSKAMLTNAFAKVKEQFQDSQKIEEVPFENEEEKQAAEAIVAIIDGGDLKQEIKEEVKVVKNKQSALKVKKVVMELEGENGNYVSNEAGVILKNDGAEIAFESVEQLDQWCDEIREVFSLRAATN